MKCRTHSSKNDRFDKRRKVTGRERDAGWKKSEGDGRSLRVSQKIIRDRPVVTTGD